MKAMTALMVLLGAGIGSIAEAKEWTLMPSNYGAIVASTGSTEAGNSATSRNVSGDGDIPPQAPVTEAFLRFDLTPFLVTGRPVRLVGLEWQLEGVRPDTVSTFFLYVVPRESVVPEDQTDSVPVTTEEDLIGIWEFTSWDYERNGCGVVRFEMTDLVSDWVSGARVNSGIVIKTREVGDSVLRSQLVNARLVVR